jgi:hypothetical protein
VSTAKSALLALCKHFKDFFILMIFYYLECYFKRTDQISCDYLTPFKSYRQKTIWALGQNLTILTITFERVDHFSKAQRI